MKDYYSSFLNTIYPEAIVRYPNLRKAYESLHKFDLKYPMVLLTNGAEGAIRAVIEFYRGLDTISIPSPSYEMVKVLASIYDLKTSIIKYNSDFELKDFNADVMYLANPDSCTGSIVSKDRIETMCKTGNIVIIDEAYYEFSGVTCIDLVDKYDNLYVIRSFSKAFGASGIRIGMVISNSNNILKLVQNKPAYEISSIACEYLDFVSPKIIKASVERLLAGKRKIEEHLSSLGYKVRKTYGNFILVPYSESLLISVSRFAYVKVITIAGDNYIRITTTDEHTAEWLIKDGAFSG